MSELKPCPFCGIKPELVSLVTPVRYFYHCPNCGVGNELQGFDSDEAQRFWNTRPIEDALRAELARRDEELKITDGLLKEATVTIGAVIACCTYNSNDDAKIGIYGIDQIAFTKIDQFITHYNDAVPADKVSVDVKPVQRPADPSLEEDE